MKFDDPTAKITPYTAEEMTECSTPQGIRAYLNRKSYYCGSPLVYRIFELAHVTGLSGEDKYTILAFEALKAAETAREELLTYLRNAPGPQFVMPT